METFDLFSLIIIPFSLFFFIFDFLRDDEIVKDELKIGTVQYIHHLAFTLTISGLICTLLFSTSITTATILVLLSTIMQIGWLINNDYCWLTLYSNRLIGTKCKNRKWIAEISSLIKHYIRGDDWAYTGMYNIGRNTEVIKLNTLLIILLIKIIIKRTRHGYI